jgi:N-methylhydantoinase A
MATRIGVDVGGTFTDLIFYDDESGEVVVAKEPTTPAAPEDGVVAAVGSAVPDERVRRAEYFLHGTTVGLNSLLERRGAVVGLLATRGFRDALEIRRGDRDDPYDLFPAPVRPLVPRRLRLPVDERIRADGGVHSSLDEDDVRRALAVFGEEGVGSVAVSFINAYANPEHELAAERVLRSAGFDGDISLSHRVSGEYREYERTSTTVIDAFVRPRMSAYLTRLEERLRDAGFNGTLLVTRSGGGAMTFAEAEARPFETILSGPVAGAEGAAELARALDLGDVVSADVGGTSFDTCLITDGRPQVMYEGRVDGMPVQAPWIDVRSIGAGGGSIAYVDVGGLLRVGPRSAGAEPGPAAYGRGGTEPTVTDAALVLGMLGEGVLAAGIRLDRSLAQAALAPLGERLGLSVGDVARGILTIANASMADTIREISAEQGHDPREATLMAFGGAGPVFATLLARELGIGRIVIPPYAGNFSAWGLLGSDLTQEAARTQILPLDAAGLAAARATVDGLFSRLEPRAGSAREVRLDVRYVGQEHTLTIAADLGSGVAEIRRVFTQEYERTFGHVMDEAAEIVALRASSRTPLPRRTEAHPAAHGDGRAPRMVDAHSFRRGERLPFALVERSSLGVGENVVGPAIVVEETATTYLDAGYGARVDPSGCLVIDDAR